MSNNVFANGREIACKKGSGKSICAFPDVVWTPPDKVPPTPTGVPVPYPNTGMASDTSKGSKKVKVSGKEAMLKNSSHFKKSIGDEAGVAQLKGFMTMKKGGKIYFQMWSMDVKIEGKNVVRHFDIATHNHGSQVGNTPPWMYIDDVALAPPDHPCKSEIDKMQRDCGKKRKTKEVANSKGRMVDVRDCNEKCKKSMSCILVPKDKDKELCCHPENTGHHMIEDQWIKGNSEFPWYRSNRLVVNGVKQSIAKTSAEIRTIEDAPCVCCNRYREVGTTHRDMHDVQGLYVEQFRAGGAKENDDFTYGVGKNSAINAHQSTFDGNCDSKCLESQLDEFYGEGDDRKLNLPERKQGLADAREELGPVWNNTIGGNAPSLTQNLGAALLKAIGGG